MSNIDELNRLMFGETSIQPEGFSVQILVKCDGNSFLVLERTKDVIKRIITCKLSFDDSINEWKNILPEWFIQACSPEINKEEAERILKTPNGFELLANMWSLGNFIEWFRPEERCWYWWNGIVKNPNLLIVQIVVDSTPFAWGALKFLIKASGADEVKEL